MIARIVSFLIGYAFGNIVMGYILGGMKGVDITKEGSGNVGATNTLRTLGKKMGAITLLCDILKVIIAGVISWLLFNSQMGDDARLTLYYAGLGAVIGHMFPIYMLKNGGKGVASTLGVAIMPEPVAAAIALGIFIIIVLITRYVSLGSIIAAVTYFVCVLVLALTGNFALTGTAAVEAVVIAGIISALIIIKHHANIMRLIHGTESRFSLGKK